MRASILDLRNRMREILHALDLNEVVTLTYRGQEKAKIIPSQLDTSKLSLKEHPAYGIWKDRADEEEVDQVVRRMRKGRSDAI